MEITRIGSLHNADTLIANYKGNPFTEVIGYESLIFHALRSENWDFLKKWLDKVGSIEITDFASKKLLYQK